MFKSGGLYLPFALVEVSDTVNLSLTPPAGVVKTP